MAKRKRDVFALLGERAGNALRHLIDFVGDEVSDGGDVVRQVEVNARNGVAHMLGLVDQSFALIAQFDQEIPNPDLVVVIGALERRDFIVDQRFQLGGAGERTFDTVAHGGDLTADGLTDRDDRLVCDGLGLRKAHRHLGHGFRDDSHVLRTGEHVREQEKEDHRHHEHGGECNHSGEAEP